MPSDSILVNDCNSIIFDDENFRIEHYFRTKFLEKYTGDFYDGLMHGKGSYVWYNGKTYIGEWE